MLLNLAESELRWSHHVDDVTSAIQDQLDSKASDINSLSDATIKDNSIYFGTVPSNPSVESSYANTIFGIEAMKERSPHSTGNTIFGASSARDNDNGGGNSAFGAWTLTENVAGFWNVAVGNSALMNLEGSNNVAIGAAAGAQGSGQNNILIGRLSKMTNTSGENSNQIVIGANAIGHGDNITVIGNTDMTAIHPADDDGVDLGSSSYEFKNLYQMLLNLIDLE